MDDSLTLINIKEVSVKRELFAQMKQVGPTQREESQNLLESIGLFGKSELEEIAGISSKNLPHYDHGIIWDNIYRDIIYLLFILLFI